MREVKASDKSYGNIGIKFAGILNGKGGVKHLYGDSWKKVHTKKNLIWLHMDYTNPDIRQWLEEESNIPGPVVEALIEPSSSPRVSSVGDKLLVVLRDVNHNPGSEPEDMVAVRIWIDGNRIISTRKRDLRSMIEIIYRLEHGIGPVSTGDFLVTLCEIMTRRMGDAIDDTEEEIARIEDETLHSHDSKLNFELAELRRQAIAIRRFLAPQREAMYRLPREKCSWLNESVRLRLREAGDRQVRHLEDLDAVRERASIMQEEINSRTNEQVNRRMYILSLVTVIFMPLTFLTGLLGVNLGGIPGGTDRLGFGGFLLLLLVLGVLEIIYLRKKNWF